MYFINRPNAFLILFFGVPSVPSCLSAAVCLSRLSDTDGTGILAIFTVRSVQFVPSVPSCFRETGLQLYSGAEVSHTNRCRSVRTVRHWCRSVPRAEKTQQLWKEKKSKINKSYSICSLFTIFNTHKINV